MKPIGRSGNLSMDEGALLGYGSNGTMVFKGLWDGHQVAVKRMHIAFVEWMRIAAPVAFALMLITFAYLGWAGQGGCQEIEGAQRIIAERTGQSIDRVGEDTQRDYWMSAEESVEYGLVGKIISDISEIG